MSIFGNRVPRVEDPKLLTVGGTYVADLRIPELDGAALRHLRAVDDRPRHASRSIDVSEARTAPGVLGVFTGADIDLPDLPPGTPMFNAAMTRPFLARDRVRYVGEPVAVIVTERPEQGPDAAELVWPDYEPLPAVVDPRAARSDEVVLHEAAGTNTVVDLAFGRTDDFFDGCEVVVTQDVVNQRVAAVPLEVPGSAAAAWIDGRLRAVVEHAARPRHPRRAGGDLRPRRRAGARDRARRRAAGSAPRSAATPRSCCSAG